MGAPGTALICEKGHVYLWIDDDLYWDHLGDEPDPKYKQISDAAKNGCLCGAAMKFNIAHYGNLNDCQKPGVDPLFDDVGKEKIPLKEPIVIREVELKKVSWGNPYNHPVDTRN